MKHRVFISAHYMEIGGAETALVGLLNALNPDRVEVDFFICDHRGYMMQFIPEWVNVLSPIPAYTMIERPISEVLRKGFWGIAFGRIYAKLKSKVLYIFSGSHLTNTSVYRYIDEAIKHFMPNISNDKLYDLAINFIGPEYIITDKINAKKTISWIHSDYAAQWSGRKNEVETGRTTYIASISDDVTKTYLQVYPLCAPKIILIENILSPKFVRARAEAFDVSEEMPPIHNGCNVLSVGRFCTQKNFTNVPDICRRIKEAGLKIKWYLIGFGSEEDSIRKKISEEKMEGTVVILGRKENPYPYIKACDIYAQPSKYEGKSVAVREAQMLGKPVIVTNYPTAPSQVKDGFDGIIVPMNNENCADEMVRIITDRVLIFKIKQNLAINDYGNETEVEKIYSLIEH